MHSTYIRRVAFEKLATLAAKYPGACHTNTSDIDRLRNACRRPKASPTGFLDDVFKGRASPAPIRIRDLDALLSLCEAAPLTSKPEDVAKLVTLFTDYLPDCCSLVFNSSPFLHSLETPPWELLTRNLITALLSLGLHHPSHHDQIYECVLTYVENCYRLAKELPTFDSQADRAAEHGEAQDITEIAALAVSLVGLLDGMSTYTHFWSPRERLCFVEKLHLVLSEQFLVAVETTSSTIRNLRTSDLSFQNWRRYARLSASAGRPLSSMLLQKSFLGFVRACTSPVAENGRIMSENALLDRYINSLDDTRQDSDDISALAKYSAQIAADQIQLLEEGSDYLQLGMPWQQNLAFTAKSFALVTFINCIILDEDSADIDLLLSWLETTIFNPDQMASEELATISFKSLVVLSRISRLNAPNLTRSLLQFIVQNRQSGAILAIAARSLAQNLQLLSQDTIIGTLYSLGNVLSASPTHDKTNQHTGALAEEAHLYTRHLITGTQRPNDSFISLTLDSEGDSSITYKNVIHTIITVATISKDSKIVALAQSMLLQKIGRVNVVLDACIVEETVALALKSEPTDFQLLLKFYARLYRDAVIQGNALIVDAVHRSRKYLALYLQKDNPLFKIYLTSLLESIVNKGGATDREKGRSNEVDLSAKEIYPYLRPVASLLSKLGSLEDIPGGLHENGDILSLLRDTWFNIAAHDVSLTSEAGHVYHEDLRILAEHSPPLVSDNRAELLESDIELNTVLRRGMNASHSSDKKKSLVQELPALEQEIKRLSYPKLIFLNATLLLESLRASSGDFTKILTYFLDPALNSPDIVNCMRAVVDKIVTLYLERFVSSNSAKFSAPYISQQLADTFVACCHRIQSIQQVASAAAAKIISKYPSSLCEKKSLFTLLDLLTLLWSSCLDEELDEYEWKSSFVSTTGKVNIELSDNYEFRKHTLNNLYDLARSWVAAIMNIAPLDVKGLLQTYLSEYEDDGAYGHTSMGRSFALEMGSMIPTSDQRLVSIERSGNTLLNMASDFVAQYSKRQEYRFSEAHSLSGQTLRSSLTHSKLDGARSESYLPVAQNIQQKLTELESQISHRSRTPPEMLQSVLRRAAALLCNNDGCEPSIISHLVSIPFQLFTSESIKMGISFWLGVINENPETEPRIIVEAAQAWERTIRRKKGIFDPGFKYSDPFMTKIESLPSDKSVIVKRQRKAQNIISPHLHLLHFFESHFNATRLASPHIQRIFRQLVAATLDALRRTTGHPLAREIHFHIILFSLKVLRYCKGQSKVALWKLKDQILSAALSWFSHPPRWSYGANRLQVKAEDKILHDIESILGVNSWIVPGDAASRKSLNNKQDLVLALIDNERTRLRVWLSPLDTEKRHHTGTKSQEAVICGFLRLAWTENPNLAIQLASRFPSPKLQNDIRWLIFNFPEKALDDPDSLEILLGCALPQDVTFQLKYLLFWVPTNPIAAVTYFLPAYGNHPFILQYAMRALESHSVDISFFYIPQLVQALRYDALGYVERYLLETAQLSPYFAHQVIWNMKANAYKDEDSLIPDPVKPVLDKFTEELISSFSDEDCTFYEKEFSFFREITEISGKLRPYIKRSKPEKKEKIEEELRKIKVEVGVYLPSNPDGVVVGIDRKSGKPLQSHAKAPYMATFRIKKTKSETNGNGNGDTNNKIPFAEANQTDNAAAATNLPAKAETYEVWQSAIFKVGDDCRQDVLALQMIAAFRSIFGSVGLDVFVYPYRVVATAPGCGVIDVLPNSISRDMLGREAVNGLYDYFVSKYGSEDSIRFQEARSNFVKSMAAYSVISYLLQFKDRHNGNIMIDDAGHIIHIDFGFCFDIAPGGIRFERAPFKLTSEMIAVMGGRAPYQHHQPPTESSGLSFPGISTHHHLNSQSYRWFEALVVKAFLASRPYQAKLAQIVTLMLDSGLPCFKPDTLKNFRDRFVLDKSEHEAAQFMRELIRKSYASMSTGAYDQFQLWSNNIPY
ncbi:phosphatidylinositol 4-kinase [Coccidioides immitis RS]|uniref:1-phosphatidylinositol 4-kinase n=1 Tax=Coccidioides immitis (strain RS) TaxID=246410 RepID=A0A0E1S0K6_COCIM|nr:phosphatidylinositol 4-kinase [Coccidioides immitis RS]EAS28725.1 phosphatidylinositol 4-kinase [Coccidioides immitis RS]